MFEIVVSKDTVTIRPNPRTNLVTAATDSQSLDGSTCSFIDGVDGNGSEPSVNLRRDLLPQNSSWVDDDQGKSAVSRSFTLVKKSCDNFRKLTKNLLKKQEDFEKKFLQKMNSFGSNENAKLELWRIIVDAKEAMLISENFLLTSLKTLESVPVQRNGTDEDLRNVYNQKMITSSNEPGGNAYVEEYSENLIETDELSKQESIIPEEVVRYGDTGESMNSFRTAEIDSFVQSDVYAVEKFNKIEEEAGRLTNMSSENEPSIFQTFSTTNEVDNLSEKECGGITQELESTSRTEEGTEGTSFSDDDKIVNRASTPLKGVVDSTLENENSVFQVSELVRCDKKFDDIVCEEVERLTNLAERNEPGIPRFSSMNEIGDILMQEHATTQEFSSSSQLQEATEKISFRNDVEIANGSPTSAESIHSSVGIESPIPKVFDFTRSNEKLDDIGEEVGRLMNRHNVSGSGISQTFPSTDGINNALDQALGITTQERTSFADDEQYLNRAQILAAESIDSTVENRNLVSQISESMQSDEKFDDTSEEVEKFISIGSANEPGIIQKFTSTDETGDMLIVEHGITQELNSESQLEKGTGMTLFPDDDQFLKRDPTLPAASIDSTVENKSSVSPVSELIRSNGKFDDTANEEVDRLTSLGSQSEPEIIQKFSSTDEIDDALKLEHGITQKFDSSSQLEKDTGRTSFPDDDRLLIKDPTSPVESIDSTVENRSPVSRASELMPSNGKFDDTSEEIEKLTNASNPGERGIVGRYSPIGETGEVLEYDHGITQKFNCSSRFENSFPVGDYILNGAPIRLTVDKSSSPISLVSSLAQFDDISEEVRSNLNWSGIMQTFCSTDEIDNSSEQGSGIPLEFNRASGAEEDIGRSTVSESEEIVNRASTSAEFIVSSDENSRLVSTLVQSAEKFGDVRVRLERVTNFHNLNRANNVQGTCSSNDEDKPVKDSTNHDKTEKIEKQASIRMNDVSLDQNFKESDLSNAKSNKRKRIWNDDSSDEECRIEKARKTYDKPIRRKRLEDVSSESETENCFSGKRKRASSVSSNSAASADEGYTQTKRTSKKGRNENFILDEAVATPGKGRKNIREIMSDEELGEETRQTGKEEEARKKRVQERQVLLEQKDVVHAGTSKKKLVLDCHPGTKEDLISVHPKIVEKLKPHQADGIRFMFDACYESVERAAVGSGGGCILAHCMGLGKTFQTVALIHTLLSTDKIKTSSVLVLCPLTTIPNWVTEFDEWLADVENKKDVKIYDIQTRKDPAVRADYLRHWHTNGGVMILGYQMFRTLVDPEARQNVKEVHLKQMRRALLDPGPDLVVCDEGHKLKNDDTALSRATTSIRTARRIVLTGTPLQNNLEEYYCIVQFVKPNLLGNKAQFLNRFVNPITNGQYKDSNPEDVALMKERSHVLHHKVDGIVQRFDFGVLKPYLEPKYEFVITVGMSDLQANLYKFYLENKTSVTDSGRASGLFADYHTLLLIWNHPLTMKLGAENRKGKKEPKEKAKKPKNVPQKNNTPQSKMEIEWWRRFASNTALENIDNGPKMLLLLAILRQCEKINEKLLVFSSSLPTLDMIEFFLNQKRFGSWKKDVDYYRLDGKVNNATRAKYCKSFNRADNKRGRLFLISTLTGGLGISLTAANRVIIFNASWNPSDDCQSIFRIYRLGQKKPCYVYRFVSQWTMEEQIYKRQVTKLSVSCRVVDEQQIERHYFQKNINQLYTFERKFPTGEVLKLPNDRVMAELLKEYKNLILSYHEHDSLLENKQDEGLTEEVKLTALQNYEEESAHMHVEIKTASNAEKKVSLGTKTAESSTKSCVASPASAVSKDEGKIRLSDFSVQMEALLKRYGLSTSAPEPEDEVFCQERDNSVPREGDKNDLHGSDDGKDIGEHAPDSDDIFKDVVNHTSEGDDSVLKASTASNESEGDPFSYKGDKSDRNGSNDKKDIGDHVPEGEDPFKDVMDHTFEGEDSVLKMSAAPNESEGDLLAYESDKFDRSGSNDEKDIDDHVPEGGDLFKDVMDYMSEGDDSVLKASAAPNDSEGDPFSYEVDKPDRNGSDEKNIGCHVPEGGDLFEEVMDHTSEGDDSVLKVSAAPNELDGNPFSYEGDKSDRNGSDDEKDIGDHVTESGDPFEEVMDRTSEGDDSVLSVSAAPDESNSELQIENEMVMPTFTFGEVDKPASTDEVPTFLSGFSSVIDESPLINIRDRCRWW